MLEDEPEWFAASLRAFLSNKGGGYVINMANSVNYANAMRQLHKFALAMIRICYNA